MSLLLLSNFLMLVASMIFFCFLLKSRDVARCPNCNADKNFYVLRSNQTDKVVKCRSCGHELTIARRTFDLWIGRADWMKPPTHQQPRTTAYQSSGSIQSYCTYCGAQRTYSDTRFCGVCGRPFSEYVSETRKRWERETRGQGKTEADYLKFFEEQVKEKRKEIEKRKKERNT